MKKRNLLLWTFLQLCVVLAIAQPNTQARMSSLKIQKPDLPVSRAMQSQLHALQKQALNLKLPFKSLGKVEENDEKKIYGFLEYDNEIKEKGIVEFPFSNLQSFEFLYKTQGFTICAGAYANNRYYYYVYTTVSGHNLPLGFYEMDLESGKSKMIKDYATMVSLFGDMTYDYSTNTMWAYTMTDEGPQLLTVDLVTGDCKEVAFIKESLLGLAADGNGSLYGITGTGDLYSINKVDGTMTLVGATGISPKYLQSMEFDRSNNVLYWAASTSDDKGILATVDTKTGKATSLGTLGNNSQVLGLFVPYVPSKQKAPMAPVGLTVTTEGNENKAWLEWTNPEKDVDGKDLDELLNVKIYRGGDLIQTLEKPAIGAKASYKDTEAPTGLMTYSVTATNKGGESSNISVEKYIGRDVPAAPGNLSVTKLSDNSVKVSWSAPLVGFNGGWIDTSTLKYEVTRYPDEVVLAEATDALSFDDSNITEYNNYFYMVQASNADGQGDMAITGRIGIGNPFAIPYACDFDSVQEFNKWFVIDNDGDGRIWNYYQNSAEYKMSSYDENGGDDWLVSPPVQIEKDEAYKMSFSVATGGYTEKLRITFGKEATKESQSVVLDDSKYSSPIVKKTVYLPHGLEKGNYRVGFYAHSDVGSWYIRVDSIKIEKSEAGEIKGQVTGNGTKISDCNVMVKETGASVTTDTEGNYRIMNVEAGEYTLVFSATGYEVQEKKATVQKKTASVADCDLVPLPQHTVMGKVTDGADKPLANIHVRIGGYADLEATTDANGMFTINKVYKAASYTVTIHEEMYYYYSKPFAMADADVNLGTIALKERVLPPYGVAGKIENKNMFVSWQKPAQPTDFSYDDGVVTGNYSMYSMDDNCVCGVAYRAPALLNSASWYLPEMGNGNKETVNIYIFDLDASGMPTSRIIYSVKDVPTQLEAWSTYYFPEEVYAPNGYMVALGVSSGDLFVGLDSGSLSFAENAQYMTYNGFDEFYTLQSTDIFEKNLLIRANATPTNDMETTEPAQIADSYTYKVWRFMEGKAYDETLWTQVSSGALSENTCMDAAWDGLPQGIYYYAVKSISQSGAASIPSFSKVVYKDMFTTVNVHVNTNTVGKNADEAIVTLYNDKNQYSDTIRDNNRGSFNNVWKDKYSLRITLPGYTPVEKSNIDFSKEQSYETETYTLQEMLEKPYNIFIGNPDNDGKRLLEWDKGLFDGFESHTDFMINSPGQIGWTYIDGDESLTDGSTIFSFPGMGGKMAYVVMNCKKTTENDTLAYSGDKYLATFSAQSGHNDDLIISPELKADKDFKMSFYARSYEGALGLETFRMGYSITGTRPDDFLWIQGSKKDPSIIWTKYEFTVPADAKYVTMNCISMGQHILMIDDILIEAETVQPVKNYYTYEVYLNGKSAGQTEDKSYLLEKLAKGDYKASVRRVYSSGKSEFTDLDFTVTEGGESIQSTESGIRIYPNPVTDCFYIKGEYTGVQVMDNMGRLLIDRDNSDDCINVNGLSAGIYIVKVTNYKDVTLQKIYVRD